MTRADGSEPDASPAPLQPPLALCGIFRILSLPTEWLICAVSPREENVVWDMLLRQQRKGALKLPSLPLLILLAAIIPLFSAAGSLWTPYLGATLVVVTPMIFISTLRPPTQIAVRYRKSGCAGHMLAAPIAASEYADASLRTFLLAALHMAAVVTMWAAAWLFAGERIEIDADVAWLLSGIMGVVWVGYWLAIRGGLIRLLPFLYLLAFPLALDTVYQWSFGPNWLRLYLEFGTLLFWIGGFAVYMQCRRDYADLLRRRLFP